MQNCRYKQYLFVENEKKEETWAAVSGDDDDDDDDDDRVLTQHRHTHSMNVTTPQQIMQRWQIVQGHLIPALHQEIGLLTPKLEKLIHILEWSRIEEFVTRFSYRTGRPPYELTWLANAFVAKVVLGRTTTVHLTECRSTASTAAISRRDKRHVLRVLCFWSVSERATITKKARKTMTT